jgi:hypothetical protein
MTIDGLALQELRDYIDANRETGLPVELDDTECDLVLALMDERDERVDATAEPAPEPEGLRGAATEVVNGTTALTPDRAFVRVPRESWRRLRDALTRPAATAGVIELTDDGEDPMFRSAARDAMDDSDVWQWLADGITTPGRYRLWAEPVEDIE